MLERLRARRDAGPGNSAAASGDQRPARGWDEAIDHVAASIERIIQGAWPRSIAFYLSGQLLTEDYYVANKLAKGFIGTPHVDTNSRLCMASSVAGHRRAFGADIVPQCYDDLELADLVVLVGSNAAWCHPVLYQRIQVARAERGVRVVNIDPRRTATSEGADLHLAIKPGTDAQLWNGLLSWLSDYSALDRHFIDEHTEGFAAALASARMESGRVAQVARATGLASNDIEQFYCWWTISERVVTCYSQGVNQSAHGTDKVNAIVNCHLATGRIGKPGSGPLSLTGQPNAMGGREVGGLANMLAAHMGFSAAERDRVRRFWNAPNLVEGEGHKAVQMFEAVAAGDIKLLWVMGTNPAVSLPRADHVREAMRRLELLVVSDNVASNDTANLAHVRLAGGGVGREGRHGHQLRAAHLAAAGVSDPPGEARPDWWILSQVAARLGWAEAFSYRSAADIFREHARLSGFENNGERLFDISRLARLADEHYDALMPVQWPVRREGAGLRTAVRRRDIRFRRPAGRASSPSRAGSRGRDVRGLAVGAEHGTRARPVAHHDPHGHQPAPRRARRRALPGDASRRRRGAGPRAGHARARRDGARHRAAARHAERAAAAGLGVRADPLVGREQLRGPHRRPGAARHRSLLGPARGQGDAGPRDPVPVGATTGSCCRGGPARGRPALLGARAHAGRLRDVLRARCASAGWRAWAETLLPAGEPLTYEDARSQQFRTAVLRDGRLEAVLYVAPSPACRRSNG